MWKKEKQEKRKKKKRNKERKKYQERNMEVIKIIFIQRWVTRVIFHLSVWSVVSLTLVSLKSSV